MRNYSPFEIMAARVRSMFPKKNRIGPDDKLLAALLHHLGLSYRRVSTSMEDSFTYESVRLWHRKIGQNLPNPDRIQRHAIAVATGGRSELEAIFFLKEALKYCLNRPVVLVDHGLWYPPALEHLGLGYKQVTFKKRNAIESWFHVLKQKTKRFYNDFPFHATMHPIASYLASFMRMQNILTARIT